MSIPQSPRGWLCWAVSVSDRYEFPHSVKYEYTGKSDPRIDDRRESSISVKMLAEKASHSVCGNGHGYELLLAHYAGEASWWSFTEPEQTLIRKTARRFEAGLRKAGFLPDYKEESIPA